MDVTDAGVGLVEALEGVGLDGLPGVRSVGEGIDGHDLQIAGLNEVVEGLRGFLLVDGVGVDGAAHGVKIFAEDGFASIANVLDVGGDGDSGEQTDDDHDDHELDEGKAGGRVALACAAAEEDPERSDVSARGWAT